MSQAPQVPPPPPPPPSLGPMPARTNGQAITALVCGIAGLMCFIPAILGIVFGFIAKKKIRASAGTERGDGMATAGIVLGGLGIVVSIILVGLLIFVINLATAPIDASNDFLGHLRDGEYRAATSQLCEASPYESARTLAADLEGDGAIDRYDLNRSSISNDVGFVGGTITTGGVRHRIVLDVAKDDGSWAVCDALLDVRFPE